MDKDPKIPEDDWKAGTYDCLAPGYVPGTHEIERGEVTWHQLTTTENAQDAAKDLAGKTRRRRKK